MTHKFDRDIATGIAAFFVTAMLILATGGTERRDDAAADHAVVRVRAVQALHG